MQAHIATQQPVKTCFHDNKCSHNSQSALKRYEDSQAEAFKDRSCQAQDIIENPDYWRTLPSKEYMKIKQSRKTWKVCSYLKIANNNKTTVIICS
jgi:hypothetical protein